MVIDVGREVTAGHGVKGGEQSFLSVTSQCPTEPGSQHPRRRRNSVIDRAEAQHYWKDPEGSASHASSAGTVYG